MDVKTVGVIGAGTMGNGIAQVMAVAGCKVVMTDIDEAAVQKGISAIGDSLQRLVTRQKITESDKGAALERMKASTRLEELASDVVSKRRPRMRD